MIKQLSSGQVEFLKWIAILSMVLDHSAKALFDWNQPLIYIGRIAFPIFAFLLVHNYIYFSKNKEKQLKNFYFLQFYPNLFTFS